MKAKEQKQLNNNYPVRLWVLTIVLTPLCLFFWQVVANNQTTDRTYVLVLQLLIVFGFVFSIPAFIVVLLVYQSIRKSGIPILLIKFITISIAVIGMVITLDIIDGSMLSAIKYAYLVTIITFGLALKTRKNFS
jgi:Sec-independent protein secretion pathway component TatC